MTKIPTYVLDADSFIRSKREHYAFDICPGFWEALLQAHRLGRVSSIIPIRKELLRGKDALADWVKVAPESFFESTDGHSVQKVYQKVVQSVEDSGQYSRAAKQRFAKGADPWLIAFASAKQHELVTYEISAPESKAIVKLPDIAKAFNVTCNTPYQMLRQLKIILKLDASKSK